MIHLDHLIAATQGELRYPGKQTIFQAFSHDTRQISAGEMFVAVRGERGNGHDHLLTAVHGDAGGLLVEARYFNALSEEVQQIIEYAGVTTVLVEDTRLALQDYASYILQQWHPTVIAVTGSVGKTSTKEAIASVLSNHVATFRSWQNYNDLLGLPLSLGQLEEQHKYAVLELGCDHPGEIADLCRMVHPHIGVLTNISPVQLQYFGTLERLAAELGMLFTSMPQEGKFFYNWDDASIRKLIASYAEGQQPTSIAFAPSYTDERDIRVTWNGVQCTLPVLTLEPNSKSTVIRQAELSSHLLGEHHVATMLAAYYVGRHCGMHTEEIEYALTHLYPMPGRLKPLAGVQNTKLLDDTHNASPASMLAGLTTLNTLTAIEGRRIAILGDMLSLGNYEEQAHRIVGSQAASLVDYLITYGDRAVILAEAAKQAGLDSAHIITTSTHDDAAQAAHHILNEASSNTSSRSRNTADVILIKGSEPMRMERVTELLMAQPWEAAEQLVRQTTGWKQIVFTRAERPTWVEVDLNAIANNTRRLKSLVGPDVQVLISLKADAYGHGAVRVARTTLLNGASMLGVATVSEATPLRGAGIGAPILVFGYVPLWQMREAVRLGVTVTLYDLEAAQALSRAAVALRKTTKVHVKIDSGMGRLGIRVEQQEEIIHLIRIIKTLPGLELEGLYTHLAMADTLNKQHAHQQLSRFQHILHLLDEQGLRPPIIHAANSAATLSLPEAHFDMVRPGIAIYGLDPSPEVRVPQGFRPALSFKTQVAQVKLVPTGECISYGCTYTTQRPTLVATLPVGYADGFRRAPKNWGSVLIHEQEAPILGRVCMDQCMVDVTHIPQTHTGDEVVLIGQQGTAKLSAEQVAERLGTINYEVIAEILARVPRVV